MFWFGVNEDLIYKIKLPEYYKGEITGDTRLLYWMNNMKKLLIAITFLWPALLLLQTNFYVSITGYNTKMK